MPPKWCPLASYVTGWSNFLGNAAGDASFAFAWGQFLNAALIISGSVTKSLETEKLVGISIGVVLLWTVLNILRVDRVGFINGFASIFQICSLIIIIFVCLIRVQHLSTAKFVFTKYFNLSGWTDKSYVGAISLLAALFSFSGYEASAHMAEETNSARKNAPKGIIYTCLATGATGLALLLALLFATEDINTVRPRHSADSLAVIL